jgi:hypothetical protein
MLPGGSCYAAALVLTFAPILAPAMAQADQMTLPADAEQTLRAADAGYWRAYNACDPVAMAPFFAEDLEFYHDKGGLTRTRAGMVDATMKGICSNPNLHVRRAPMTAGVRYDPIPGYGAVLSGQHQFYMTEKGMPERPTGIAFFTMLWRYDQGRWQMTRAFSLDHQPVTYHPPQAGVVLSPAALLRYAGQYHMPNAGEVIITVEKGRLVLTTNNLKLTLAPKIADHFFALERPLQIDFAGEAHGKAAMLTIVENGAPVEQGKRDD